MKNRHKPGPIRQLALLLALLLFSSSSALAYDCCIDGIYYNLNTTDKTASVTDNDNNRYSGDVVIPETIAYNNAIYSVTSIGESAFDYCSRLTSVVIPNSVTTIDYKAFANCSGLTSVTIPNSVTAIGGWAFINCTRLSSVSFNAEKCIKMGYRKDVQGVYFVFAGCTSLTTLTIGDKVTTIPSNAFRKCSALTSVTIGNSVTSIGDYAFGGCSGLTSVTIPNSVTSIGEFAFQSCSGLTSVSIPNFVTSIGEYAFSHCPGLTSVTIGNSVTSIGDRAFSGCSGLTKLVSLAVEPPTCDNGTFKEVDKTTCQLLVPEESINKYKTADQWKEFLNILGYNGVDDVSVDSQNAVYEVYNLQGVRVGGGMREEEVTADVLPHGVYILVSPQSRKKLKI
ncbi:MAG: leucine-rich repeat domain-containing protein [Bacteroidales bacterium]|nr:leucine-rich repeat domain-containing protein [Bacteroidales bacterium]MDD6960260.1 leucine-rich repeat domain-containing protein [Bacteroidales bacterium]MDY6186303.1 leucine-rich repeat domain-containing protein [Muribaculaceae bacterium]